MKTLLILSVVLCAAVSIQAAAVMDAGTAVDNVDVAVAPPAVYPQARSSFCLSGWDHYRGSCYLLVNNHDSWTNAERYCADFDASLASAHNIWEYTYLQRIVRTGGHTFAWIGGYYFQNDWRWEDGSKFDYQNWETNASTDIYQCLQVNSQETKGWSNHGCSMRFPSVCQMRTIC